MKIFALILAGPTLLLSLGCQKLTGDSSNKSPSTSDSKTTSDTTSAYPKRYLVESGIVEYEMSGMQHGTETIYFDRWGWREAKYTNSEISIGGISRKENKFTIMDGEWIYNIDLEHRTATKTKNPMLAQFIEAAKKKDQSLAELGEEMMRNMGGMLMTSTATRFQANATIPADKITIPGDVKVTEGPDVQRVLEGIREKTKGR